MKSGAFSRSLAIFSAISVLMQNGATYAAAALKSGADNYRSRGKGRGTRTSSLSRSWNKRGKRYPFSSTKQHEKSADRHYMAKVNGFDIMQTWPSRSRGLPSFGQE